MKNKINLTIVFLLFMVVISLPIIIFGETSEGIRPYPRVVDEADLLTSVEVADLISKLDEISERQEVDVIILTVNSLDDYTPNEFADNFFDENGYGMGEDYAGILLLISMEERDLALSTSGYGITIFTDWGQNYILDQMMDDLADGDYKSAFDTYARLSDELITEANTSEPYDTTNLPDEYYDAISSHRRSAPLIWIPISLVIGLVISLIITEIMRSKLKTVGMQRSAANYVRPNSLRLRGSQDIFLYHRIDKRLKPKDNDSSSSGSSTHTSSSGRTHGGTSRKF